MTIGLPDLRRLRYFHGQLLGAGDLRCEQKYLLEKFRLRNRVMHGYGVGCGLQVYPVGVDDPCMGRHRPLVRLMPGVAVDPAGNEVVVVHPVEVDLWETLPDAEKKECKPGETLYLSIAYREEAFGEVPVVDVDGCGFGPEREFGWIRETFVVYVTRHPPNNRGCEGPCDACDPDRRLLLAKIDDVKPDEPVGADAVHLGVRRPLSRYWHTTITGINWLHGATYGRDEAWELLGSEPPEGEDGGLRVRFSTPVSIDSLTRPGVVQVHVIEGGGGRNATTWYPDGTFKDLPADGDGFTWAFRYRWNSNENPQRGDRVHITIRSPFVLDRCGRPIDGTHVAGRVPLLPGDYPQPDDGWTPVGPDVPPGWVRPWTSGYGGVAGVFESWFFIREREHP